MSVSPGGVEVGRVSVRVVPDTSRLAVDLKPALDRIESQTDLKISTSIDTVALDAQAKAAVEGAQLAAGDINIKTQVDTSQVHQAESALTGAAGSADKFIGSLGGIATAAILLGPALIPVAAALTALIAPLIAPLAIVGGGLTLFGFMSGFTIAETKKQLTSIAALSKKLSGLTKGTQAYKDTAKQLRAEQKALTPAQIAFEGSLSKVKHAFDSIPKSIILKPINDGLGLLAKTLPLLTPILKAVSGALQSLIGDMSTAADSKGFKDFVATFASQLGPDIKNVARIAGSVFQGLFGLFGALNRALGGNLLRSIGNLAGKFANWGQTVGKSGGFKDFIDYIKQVVPGVIDTIKSVARAFGKVVSALAPLGPPVLRVVKGIADAISGIPTGVLTKLAEAMVAIVAVQKLGGFKAIGLLSKGLGGASSGLLGRVVGSAKPINVFVVNEGFGGAGGSGGKGVVGKLFSPITSVASGFLAASGLSAAAAAGWASAGAAVGFAAVKGYQLTHTNALLNGPLGFNTIVDKIGSGAFHIGPKPTTKGFLGPRDLGLPEIRSVGTAVDGLWANLGRASTRIDQIGPHARNSFGEASSVLSAFADKVATLRDKKFTILVNDLEAVRKLEALQAFRFKDKTINITTNLIERSVGPGGGIGQPSPNNANSVPNPTPRTATPGHGSSGGDTYNIQAHDYNDFLRQLASRRRGRAGGGVPLERAGVR